MRQPVLYALMRRFISLALGFYFRRLERFHAERVPPTGPVLFASNHPNSLADSFVIGASVSRKVNFVATVQLFRFGPVKWLLTRCGVVPINRAQDDPKAMRTVAETFAACFRLLERGEAIGLFPEGVSYDDSQLKEVKSGAARMALELEHRHDGRLGLQLLPVGLTYSAKEVYRSDALVHFGEPIRVADFLPGYAERRKECIRQLTAELERRLRALILDLPQLEHARVVAAVQRLYLDRLRLGNRIIHEPAPPRAEELLLTQRIAALVEHVYRAQPMRAAAFAARLGAYERWLARLSLTDADLALCPSQRSLLWHSLGWAALAVLGAPIAVYGWLHRALPYALVKWAERRFTQPGKRKAQTASTALVAGPIAFGLFYLACVLVFHHLFGWPASFWYALSLPAASLLARNYLRQIRRLAASFRHTWVLARAPLAARRLLARRATLIAEIEAARVDALPAPGA